MAMRVTQGMEYLQALANIQQGAAKLFDVQGQLGSGHKIQKPSDDPTGAARILEYARQQGQLDQDRQNILAGKSSLESAASELQSMADSFNEARERAVQGVSGTVGADDRKTIADELDNVLTSLLNFANGRDGSGYAFAGSKNGEPPFVRKTGADGIERVVYQGDDKQNFVEVAPGVTEPFNIPGSHLIDVGPRGPTQFSGTTGIKSGAGSDSGTGFANLVISHTVTRFGPVPGTANDPASGVRVGASSAAQDTILGSSHSISVTVAPGGSSGQVSLDGGPTVAFRSTDTDLAVTNAAGDVVHLDFSQAVAGYSGTVALTAQGAFSLDGGKTTVPINLTATGQSLFNPADGTVTHVDSTGITRTGTSKVTYTGTIDLFNAILSIRDLLRTTGTPQQVTDAVNEARDRIGDLDKGMDAILRATAEAGSGSDRLTGLDQRLADLQVTVASRRSDFEDADYSQLLVELNAHQTVYQAALSVTAKLSQLSLANYLA